MVSATGIVESRKPRDIFCLVIFIAFYALIIYWTVQSTKKEGVDLDRTYWPLDYYGRFCGKDAEFNKVIFEETWMDSALVLIMDTGRSLGTDDDSYSPIENYLDQSDRDKLFWPLVLLEGDNSGFNIHEAVCVSECPVLTEEFAQATSDKDWDDIISSLVGLEDKTTMVCHRDIRDLGASTLPTSGITTLDVVNAFKSDVATANASAWGSGVDYTSGYGTTNSSISKVFAAYASGNGPRSQTFGLSGSDENDVASSAVTKHCFYVVYDTEDYEIPGVKGRCLPSGGISFLNKELASYLDGVLGLTTSITSAIRSTYGIILGSMLAGIIFGFVWLLLLRVFAYVITWIMLIGLLVSLTYLAYTCYHRGQVRADVCATINCNSSYESTGKYYRYAGYVLGIIDLLYICFLLFARSRIALAITVTVEAGKAIGAMKQIVLVPIPFIFVSLAVATGMGICVYMLWGSGDFSQEVGHRSFEGDNVWKFLYSVLGLLWGIQFVSGIQIAVIAGAVVSWYWRRDRRKKIHGAILKSLGRVFVYHLGSIAFGSFLIALIQWIRFLLRYFQKKTKALKENATAKFIINCVDCCLKYCEKVLKYVNKNAYIYMTIYGTNYVKSAASSFVLLLKNIVRVFAINTVGDFLLFVGKLFIAAANAFLVYGICYYKYKDSKLDDYIVIVPTTVAAILGYVVGDMFMGVYETTVDTILFSFIIDEKENDGTEEKPYFMTASLRKTLSGSAKRSARKANKEGKKDKKGSKEEDKSELVNVAQSDDDMTEPEEEVEGKEEE